jgi:EAL domain-containing protein (putative c-di-GMP-specific phosphodiesterase class I)/GGDEF domain-containing protein
MSPLSLLRVLFAIGAPMWAIAGLAWRWRGLSGGLILAFGALMLAVWVALLAVRSVTVTHCRLLAGLWVIDVSVLLWSGRGQGLALAWVSLYLPMAIFVAVFLEPFAVFGYQMAALVGLGLALAPTQGAGRATVIALMSSIALLSVSAAALLFSRSARRQDTLDPDTGLPNGFGLAQRMPSPGAGLGAVVAGVVLEGLGDAREAMGYQVGTELLRRAVEDLGQVLPADALVGRVEADEVIVIERLDDATGAEFGSLIELAEDQSRVGQGVDRPPSATEAGLSLAWTLSQSIGAGRYVIDDVEVSLRAHIGLAVAPWDGTTMSELVRRASLSAHRASASGELQAFWQGDGGAMTREDLAILGDLRKAAQRDELYLMFQPQVEINSEETIAVESLLRWKSSRHGEVPPQRFIGLAERTGLIDRLSEWILGAALDARARWRQRDTTLGISVNLSARTLARPDLADWILSELDVRDLPAECLTLEMTETAATNLANAAEHLRPLRARGVRVSVDDFGTGYTSLAALPTFPLDELKIDQRFVRSSGVSSADEAIVRAVSELGHRLGLTVVAEGVEDEDTVERMRAAGCDVLQGYYFARPMSEVELLGSRHCATSRAERP